jgi:hypothetical protein
MDRRCDNPHQKQHFTPRQMQHILSFILLHISSAAGRTFPEPDAMFSPCCAPSATFCCPQTSFPELEFLPLKTVHYAALICAAMSWIKANVLHARNSFVRGARRARWEIASMVIHSDASFPTPMA